MGVTSRHQARAVACHRPPAHTHRQIRALTHADRLTEQVVAGWLCLAMLGMTTAFGVAGVLQTYIERVMGLGYMTAQAQMRFWFAILSVLGVALLFGAVLLTVDLLSLRPARLKVKGEA